MLIDSHCHLEDWVKTNQIEKILAEAHEQDVQKFVTVGTQPEDWHIYASLASRYNCIQFCAGLHPLNIQENFEVQLEQLPTFLSHAIAMGEIGLDFHQLPHDKSEQIVYAKRQIVVFEKQLRLAQKHNMPVVIHCRDAFEIVGEVLKYTRFDLHNVLFHCFTGTPQEAEYLLAAGAFLSYAGVVTFKNAQAIQNTILATPLDRILVETDCPYLAPVPYRGKTNTPALLPYTARHIASLKQMDFQAFCEMTVQNTQTFFRTCW
ncbi:MAG: TatD family hydrolase [Puniceicoccales bacterium]|jgi:TatD DNase family protein|nr:TatD family hydrolase [Puniceicoccales bacterium]